MTTTVVVMVRRTGMCMCKESVWKAMITIMAVVAVVMRRLEDTLVDL